MTPAIPIADLAELKSQRVLLRQWGKKTVALFFTDDKIFAIEDLCPHRAGPLSEGKLDGTQISCPWHEAKFDLESGAALSGPTTKPLKKFAIEVRDEKIYLS